MTILPAIDPPFTDPDRTAAGEPRASVDFRTLETLWLNTGTLCNLQCSNCYIESSPTNDSLAYLAAAEATFFFDEIKSLGLPTTEIGITGGEPFMNPDIMTILAEALERGFSVLVLTNAMKPMEQHQTALRQLIDAYGDRLTLRVSLDHYDQLWHEEERGEGSWGPTITGLQWLSDAGAHIAIAGRGLSDEPEDAMRRGYHDLLGHHGIKLDVQDPSKLVLFPEMDPGQEATEITTTCWDTLDVRPEDQMCANARMVIKRKGADRPTIVACTLIHNDPQFELGHSLKDSFTSVKLNHPHCSQFCVLGGASCS